MENYKVKVSSEAESKEVQELFFELGYVWIGESKGVYFETSTEWIYAKIITMKLYAGSLDDVMYKELTIQQLRNLVAQQRPRQPEELPFIDDEPKSGNGEQLEGMKFDSGKPRHSLLPKGAVNSVIAVLEFGAKKYDVDNWQEVDNAKERYYNAAMRHIDLWWNGEKHDSETNIHHLAHAATNLFFLMWFDNK